MSDLIRRSELKESLIHCKELGRKSFEAVLKVIDKQPTIEAVPVVERNKIIDDFVGNKLHDEIDKIAKQMKGEQP